LRGACGHRLDELLTPALNGRAEFLGLVNIAAPGDEEFKEIALRVLAEAIMVSEGAAGRSEEEAQAEAMAQDRWPTGKSVADLIPDDGPLGAAVAIEQRPGDAFRVAAFQRLIQSIYDLPSAEDNRRYAHRRLPIVCGETPGPYDPLAGLDEGELLALAEDLREMRLAEPTDA